VKEKLFIKDVKLMLKVEEYIKKLFAQAKCSGIDVQQTPLGTRITIYTLYPGLVIGVGGENLRQLQQDLEEKFGIKNPQINVERIANPMLDPLIVAQLIASAIERGINHRRVARYYLQRVMEAGAQGCEIVISGKLGSEKARRERFREGFVAKSGEQVGVLYGFAEAQTKPGTIGVKVYISPKPEKLVKFELGQKGEVKSEGENP